MEDKDQASEKSSLSNGLIKLVSTHQSYEYDTDQWHKDSSFITVGMNDEPSLVAVTECSQQKAVIGATFLSYDVEAPGMRSTIGNFPLGVAFKRSKGKGV